MKKPPITKPPIHLLNVPAFTISHLTIVGFSTTSKVEVLRQVDHYCRNTNLAKKVCLVGKFQNFVKKVQT